MEIPRGVQVTYKNLQAEIANGIGTGGVCNWKTDCVGSVPIFLIENI